MYSFSISELELLWDNAMQTAELLRPRNFRRGARHKLLPLRFDAWDASVLQLLTSCELGHQCHVIVDHPLRLPVCVRQNPMRLLDQPRVAHTSNISVHQSRHLVAHSILVVGQHSEGQLRVPVLHPIDVLVCWILAA